MIFISFLLLSVIAFMLHHITFGNKGKNTISLFIPHQHAVKKKTWFCTSKIWQPPMYDLHTDYSPSFNEDPRKSTKAGSPM